MLIEAGYPSRTPETLMRAQRTLAAAVVAITFLGLPRADGTAATRAPVAGGTSGAGSPADRLAQGGMQTGVIHDPGLDMDAFTVPYPAKWHFQGTVLQGTECSEIPLPVYRVFSPDGLTEIERLPRLDWRWNNMPYAPKNPQGCLPFKQEMSAKDILKYLSAILKVEYVGEQPVAPAKVATYSHALEATAARPSGNGMKRFPDTGELASAIVRYKNGTFSMEGQLDAQVRCTHTQMGPAGRVWDLHSCWANVKYTHAPESQFKAVAAQYTEAVKEVVVPQWMNAYMSEQSRKARQMLATQIGAADRGMAAQQQQFEQGQAMRQRQNDEFISTMQRGTDMSMRQAAQIANSNHTISSDWVDYSLDRQTVRDPNSGQVSKVSSSSSYTWLDETGKTAYQTNDPNADPNGALKGTWTRQTRVHGDGSN
jgi:hypothetical protein